MGMEDGQGRPQLDLKSREERKSHSRKPGRCALPRTQGRYVTVRLG